MSGNVAEDQMALWNGPAGHAWVEAQALLDRLFREMEDLLVDAVVAEGANRVLDVGCGTGATTLAVARQLGTAGSCVGVDISEPMISAARSRAEREGSAPRFICADAQTHAFEPATFDMIISRFGVMFFSDPIRAFANLRRAAREGGELRVIVWRSAQENPFMTTAERAAAPLLPNLPTRPADAPGQFAFADRNRVRRILEESGWAEVQAQPLDVACAMPERELTRYLAKLGPVGSILRDADDRTRARVVEAIRPAFDPYVHGAEVRFTAACWMVSARAGAAAASTEAAHA